MKTSTDPPRALVVTIDTEEEGLFTETVQARGATCENVRRLPRLHAIFRRLGVVPTYLVDWPVVEDPAAREVLAEFARVGEIEIGAHLHPWCNPPFEDHLSPSSVYPHRLATALFEAKLALLRNRLEEAFGARPTSYRAGRWGFDHTSVPVLERLGFLVDSSVTPLWADANRAGGRFTRAPHHPYRLSRGDACAPGTSSVVEVPVNNLVAGAHGPLLERVVRRIGQPPGLRRVLYKLGLASLRPEHYPLAPMRAVADETAARGLPVFNVMFHSSVALPGGSPYVKSERDLDAFCERLEGILEYVLTKHRATPIALSRVPAFLGEPTILRRAIA